MLKILWLCLFVDTDCVEWDVKPYYTMWTLTQCRSARRPFVLLMSSQKSIDDGLGSDCYCVSE